MTTNNISFGLVVTPTGTGRSWVDQVKVLEQQGWTSLLVPDTLWTPSPFPTLAAAAAVTSTVRLRSWVLAAPLRSPATVVRESNALQLLSDQRFELGIGTGRPDAEREAAQLGVPWGSAAQRIGQVELTIAAVRQQVRPNPQIVVAAAGPRMLASAAKYADRIALALPPTASEQDLAAAVGRAVAARQGAAPDADTATIASDGKTASGGDAGLGRAAVGAAAVGAAAAGASAGGAAAGGAAAGGAPAGGPTPIGLSQQLFGLAGRLPTWLTRGGLDAQALISAGAVGMLTGDPAEMADTLLRRRTELGIDEFIVPGELAEDFAPVISRLTR